MGCFTSHLKREQRFFLIYPLYNDNFIFSKNRSISSISLNVLQFKTNHPLLKSFYIDLEWSFKNTWRKMHRLSFSDMFILAGLNQIEMENLKSKNIEFYNFVKTIKEQSWFWK